MINYEKQYLEAKRENIIRQMIELAEVYIMTRSEIKLYDELDAQQEELLRQIKDLESRARNSIPIAKPMEFDCWQPSNYFSFQ